MGRVWIFVCVSTLAACTALSGADSLRVGDVDSPPPPGTTKDAAVEGDASVDGADPGPDDSGTGESDANAPDASTAVFVADFDSVSECTSWSTEGTAVHDSDGHAGPGACRLCAPVGGDVDLSTEVTTSRAGRLAFSAWVRRVGNGVSVPGFASLTYDNSNSEGSFMVSSVWSEQSAFKLPAPSGKQVTLRVGMRDAGPGDCIAIDDVVLRIE